MITRRAKIRGYTDRQSVAQGQRINFCLSNLSGSALSRIPIRIVRLGLQESEVASDLVSVPAQRIPTSQAWESNDWKISYQLEVGNDWRPGVYVARFGRLIYGPDIFFVVKSADPGATTPIVIQIPTTTINAYNNWGGASLYAYNSKPLRATAVSFNRPQYADSNWSRGFGFADEWNKRIKAFVQWMEVAGYAPDFITNNDLHEDRSILKHYRLFISIGHDEYWSREMRTNFDAFVAAGGNAAIFGGNTCYWQIRLEPDQKSGAPNRRQVCHKTFEADPIEDKRLKTILWRNAGYPENASFGAGFAAGALRGRGARAAFTVHRPEHWAFQDTSLREGGKFGGLTDGALLRYETNGVQFTLDRCGRPVPTGADGTPPNYLILALAELNDWEKPGNAAMGVFTMPEGGTVFNAATTDWARGLRRCVSAANCFRTTTAKITRNVIERLIATRPGEGRDARPS